MLVNIINKYYKTFAFAILFFAFATRIWQLHLPEVYIFDEVYHAITTKLISRNDPRAFEWWNPPVEPNTAVDWLHPPIAKYTQAFMIIGFGENSFGWRVSSAIFGVGVIGLTIALSEQLFNNKSLSLLAGLLASLDGLLLTQSRIAMNDIHVTFFILLTFYLYLKYQRIKNYKYIFWVGLGIGLAIATKWSGLFIWAAVILFEVVRLAMIAHKKSSKQKQLPSKLFKILSLIEINKVGWLLASLILLPLLIYVGSYWQMYTQGKDLSHFVELHRNIIWYQTNLEATHPYQSRPWQWFLNLKPVWYYVGPSNPNMTANIYATGNTTLFWFGAGASILTAIYLVAQRFVSDRLFTVKTQVSLCLLSAVYWIVWLPWILSPRIMFFYHYTPAVPLLAINLAFWIVKFSKYFSKSKLRFISYLVVGLIILNFVLWYPHWTAISVPTTWANNLYFAIPSWK